MSAEGKKAIDYAGETKLGSKQTVEFLSSILLLGTIIGSYPNLLYVFFMWI